MRGEGSKVMNQGPRPCVHICMAHATDKGEGKAGRGDGGGLKGVYGGEKETYVILPTIKNYIKII